MGPGGWGPADGTQWMGLGGRDPVSGIRSLRLDEPGHSRGQSPEMPAAPQAPARIYVRLPNWVGDVVMCTPALRALRRSAPQAEIIAEGKAFQSDMVMALDSVDGFIADPGRRPADLLRHGRLLAEERFDWAVLLGESERAAMPAFLARIPVRAGYGRGLLRRAMLTHRLRRPKGPGGEPLVFSMIERYSRVTRALGVPDDGSGMDLQVPEPARAAVETRLDAEGLGADARLITVVVGAAFGSSKMWPPGHFAASCDALFERHGWRAVLAPGPGEEALAEEVVALAKHPVLSIANPVLDLCELAALLERSQLVISNDTGPRSMAVALGLPVVVAVGPIADGHTRHHLKRQRVLMADVHCRPCNHPVCPTDHRCMTRITPEQLVSAADELLEAEGPGQVRP